MNDEDRMHEHFYSKGHWVFGHITILLVVFSLLILTVFFVVGIARIACAEGHENDFFPVVNLVWDPAGVAEYIVEVRITRDSGKEYQYQVGPITRTFYKIDVDPTGFHEVRIFSMEGDLLYSTDFRHEDLPGIEAFEERSIR